MKTPLVLAVCLAASIAEAREYTGSTSCGPYRLEVSPGDGTLASPGAFTGQLCGDSVRIRGGATQITWLKFQYEPGKFHEVRARLTAPDPASRASVEAFLVPVKKLQLAAVILAKPERKGIADIVFNENSVVERDAHRASGGADVGCSDAAEMAGTVGVAAYVDMEPSLVYDQFYVPPWCTVIVDGRADVKSLRVDGILLRLGGGLDADTIATGTVPVFVGKIVVAGLPVPEGMVRGAIDGSLSALTGADLQVGPGVVTAKTITLEKGSSLAADALEAERITAKKSQVDVGLLVRVPSISLEDGSLAARVVETATARLRANATLAGSEWFGHRRGLAGSSAAVLDADAGTLSGGRVELGSAKLARGAKLRAQALAVRGTLQLDGSSAHADAMRLTTLRATSSSVKAGELDAEDVEGTDLGIVAGRRVTVRTGAGRIKLTRGSITVSAHVAAAPEESPEAPVDEPAGAADFAACLATPPGIDATLLETSGTAITARHPRVDRLLATGGAILPVRTARPSGIPLATLCLEATRESRLTDVAVAAAHLHASLGSSQVRGRSTFRADQTGGEPRPGSVTFQSGATAAAHGASFGGYGGSDGQLHGATFSPAAAPVDEPRQFRADGLGGMGADAAAMSGFNATRGFPGGGAIRVVARDLVFDGILSADGQKLETENGAGGGSGGSITITVEGAFGGTGAIHADGGNGGYGNQIRTGGGGSGGRIRIDHGGDAGWKGTVTAYGGLGGRHHSRVIREGRLHPPWNDWRNHGGPGTIYWKPKTGRGRVVVAGPPLEGGRHRGVGHVSGDFSGDEVVVRRAFAVTDTLRAAALTLEDHAVLTADEPRLRLPWPPRRKYHEGTPYPDEWQGAPNVSATDFPEEIWREPLEERLAIELTADLTVDATSRLHVDGLGSYSQERILRSDTYWNRAGGSHGGLGGLGSFGGTQNLGVASAASGSGIEPTTFGEAGFGHQDWNGGRRHPLWGLGGAGGGVLRVRVGGTARIDGALAGNGADGIPFMDHYTDGQGTGGGAGGSVWLSARTLAGSGTVSASGGAGTIDPTLGSMGGGGGGGRVRIDVVDRGAWRGTATAVGGAGGRVMVKTGRLDPWQDPRYAGGPGTVFWKPEGAAGTLVIDGEGGAGGLGWLRGTLTPDTVARVELRKARVLASGLDVAALTVGPEAALLPDDPRWAIHYLAQRNSANRFALLHVLDAPAAATPLVVTVRGDLSIDKTGAIDVSGAGGYGQSAWLGGNVYVNRAGGSHGARGGAGRGRETSAAGAPADANGDADRPATPGAGGFGVEAARGEGHPAGFRPCQQGGDGGGALRLTVGGTLSVAGMIRSDGANGAFTTERCESPTGTGGGAGGSIWITAGTLTGGGSIKAAGGIGSHSPPTAELAWGGGGSGGRVAIDAATCSFTGVVHAPGGGSAGGDGVNADTWGGEPGTVRGNCPRR